MDQGERWADRDEAVEEIAKERGARSDGLAAPDPDEPKTHDPLSP
jgi:hypothetical protein